ncbi:unnamed protein product [Rhizoctonia solani]|uniref:BTB domain-containing protein n=1 Tax=Rhizoctonia solani TaxID=456999 RepID=A0A8H3H466_9AGAM|nr:unnamed protein product [Rhizoctonia solani]
MARQKSTILTSQAGSVVYVGKGPDTKSDGAPDNNPETQALGDVVPHPQFFLDNTLVAIQIEKTLFNVHKYQLVKSEFFSDMLKEPKVEDEKPEAGSSPEHPIVIKGVAASDFAALLKVLYASHFSGEKHVPETPLIIPAFRLANLLDFSELRTYLLPLAEQNLGDVDKIIFAREFDITEWLAPAHVHLCQREEPLSTEEARKLGVDSVLIVWRMREQHRSRTTPFNVNQDYCYSCAGLTYTGTSNACVACDGSSGYGYLHCDGPGRVAQSKAFTADNAAILAGVKKWVNDNCVVKN